MSQMKLNRREAIVNLVKIKRQVTILELSKEFGVTEETIRKDLQELSPNRENSSEPLAALPLREYGTERSLDQRNHSKPRREAENRAGGGRFGSRGKYDRYGRGFHDFGIFQDVALR